MQITSVPFGLRLEAQHRTLAASPGTLEPFHQLEAQVNGIKSLINQYPVRYGDLETRANRVLRTARRCDFSQGSAEEFVGLLKTLSGLPASSVGQQTDTLMGLVLQALARPAAQTLWHRWSPERMAVLGQTIAAIKKPEVRDVMSQLGAEVLRSDLARDKDWSSRSLCSLLATVTDVLIFSGAERTRIHLLAEIDKRGLTAQEGVRMTDLSQLIRACGRLSTPESAAIMQRVWRQIVQRDWNKETDWNHADLGRLVWQARDSEGVEATAAREKLATMVVQYPWETLADRGPCLYQQVTAIKDWDENTAPDARNRLAEALASHALTQKEGFTTDRLLGLARALDLWQEPAARAARDRVAEAFASRALTPEEGLIPERLVELAMTLSGWKGAAARAARVQLASEIGQRALTQSAGYSPACLSSLARIISRWRGDAVEGAREQIAAEFLSRPGGGQWRARDRASMSYGLGKGKGACAQEALESLAVAFLDAQVPLPSPSLEGWFPAEMCDMAEGFSQGAGPSTQQALTVCAQAICDMPRQQLEDQWSAAQRLRMSNAIAQGDGHSDVILGALDKLETDRRGYQEVDDRPLGYVQP